MSELVEGYDAVEVAAMPTGGGFYLAYVDGAWVTLPEVEAAHPNTRILTITTNGKNRADLGDCESGDLTPSTVAVLYKKGEIGAIYSDTSSEQEIADAVGGRFDWFPADPTGTSHLYVPKTSLARVVGTQWGWGQFGQVPGNYDADVALASWLDPAPAPPAPSPTPEGTDMAISPVIEFKPGQLDVFQVSDGVLWHKYAQAGKWTNEAIPLPAGFGPVVGDPEVSIQGGACWVAVEDASGRACLFVQTADSSTWANQPLP